MPEVKTASDLYGVPLNQFTPERNALAKRLKAVDEKDRASEVSKLRKPTTAAWIVNQLVRTQPKRIAALFQAGDAVTQAQSRGQADKLRAAATGQRTELADLLDRAGGLLDSEGRPPAAGVLERVAETLRAAAIDPASRRQVEDGCLTRELRFTGLTGFEAGAAPASTRRGEEAKRRREVEKAQELEKQAQQEHRQAERELRDAEKNVAAAERTRDRRARQVEEAEAALAEARQHLERLQRGPR